jgi:hypothetical protein
MAGKARASGLERMPILWNLNLRSVDVKKGSKLALLQHFANLCCTVIAVHSFLYSGIS